MLWPNCGTINESVTTAIAEKEIKIQKLRHFHLHRWLKERIRKCRCDFIVLISSLEMWFFLSYSLLQSMTRPALTGMQGRLIDKSYSGKKLIENVESDDPYYATTVTVNQCNLVRYLSPQNPRTTTSQSFSGGSSTHRTPFQGQLTPWSSEKHTLHFWR